MAKIIFLGLIVGAFLGMLLVSLGGCATRGYPPTTCLEHGMVKHETANFVFCKNGVVYSKQNRYYIPRTEELDLPDVDPGGM